MSKIELEGSWVQTGRCKESIASQVGVAGAAGGCCMSSWLDDLVCQVRVWGDLSVRKWEEGEEEVAALSSWMWSLI